MYASFAQLDDIINEGLIVLAKAVAKDVTVSEAMQGQEFLDLITNEKQIEGDGKDDQN